MTSPRDLRTAHPTFAKGCCVTYVRGGDLTGIAQLVKEEGTVDYAAATVSGLALLHRVGEWTVLLEPPRLPGRPPRRSAGTQRRRPRGQRRLGLHWPRPSAGGRQRPAHVLGHHRPRSRADVGGAVHRRPPGCPRARRAAFGRTARFEDLPAGARNLCQPSRTGWPGRASRWPGTGRPCPTGRAHRRPGRPPHRHHRRTGGRRGADRPAHRRGRQGPAPRLAELADRYAAIRHDPATPPEEMRTAFYRFHGAQAVLAALGDDPGKAAWQACYRATSAVGGSFDDQLRIEVLRRLVEATIHQR